MNTNNTLTARKRNLAGDPIPAAFLDPVTKEPLLDAYNANDGYNYNLSTLQALLDQYGGTDFQIPILSPAVPQVYITYWQPNLALRSTVRTWLSLHGLIPPLHNVIPPLIAPSDNDTIMEFENENTLAEEQKQNTLTSTFSNTPVQFMSQVRRRTYPHHREVLPYLLKSGLEETKWHVGDLAWAAADRRSASAFRDENSLGAGTKSLQYTIAPYQVTSLNPFSIRELSLRGQVPFEPTTEPLSTANAFTICMQRRRTNAEAQRAVCITPLQNLHRHLVQRTVPQVEGEDEQSYNSMLSQLEQVMQSQNISSQ